jgi:hypothetical protein
MLSMTSNSSISIRPAAANEEPILRDLSELDATPQLQRPALLALVDDQPVAALSLTDGRVAADPFTRTEDVVVLLRAYLKRLPQAA